MGLLNKKKTEDKGKAEYRQVGGLFSNDKGANISTNDFNGQLVFIDKKSGVAYKVKYLNLYEPKRKSGNTPEALEYDVVINLASEHTVEYTEE